MTSDVEAVFREGIARTQAGEFAEAERLFRHAVLRDPRHAHARLNLGTLLIYRRAYDEAVVEFRNLIAAYPRMAAAHYNLGYALDEWGRLDAALEAFTAAVSLDPNLLVAHSNRAGVLQRLGRVDEAVALTRQLLAVAPLDRQARENLCYTVHFQSGATGEEILREHRIYDDLHARPLRWPLPQNVDRAPERRLRLGYLSPHLWAHVVGRNLLPVLEHHDRKRFEIFCYSNNTGADDQITARMRQLANRWLDVQSLDDEQLARQIRADEVDILVDLALFMGGHRISALARKPAPIQITHMGYPATTGLSCIDYRISDPHLDPPGGTEAFNSERIIRLPHSFWIFRPFEPAPDVGELPALRTNQITFGSLNNPVKFSGAALGAWSEILQHVPNSRLMLLVNGDESSGSYLASVLTSRGVSRDRLEFVTKKPAREYFETYNGIDIGLDPFPYNGHSTSLDASWMGVPVVTIEGKTSVARAGVCLCRKLGLPELIATSIDEYINIARDLASDLPRLSALRMSLRARMRESPLCDAAGYTRALETSYRDIWTHFCNDGRA